MKQVSRASWELLKKESAEHLENPLWQGGSFCVNREHVLDRPALAAGPWEAMLAAGGPVRLERR